MIILDLKRVLKVLRILKGVTKSYFMHYSCVSIILFNTDLYMSTFSTYFLKNLFFFSLSVFRVFCLFCFEFDVIFKEFL